MKVAIFSAAARASQSGNWVTASRWKRELTADGISVSIIHDEMEVDRCRADVLIGLHARRSAKALIRFKRFFPQRSTIVVFSGTDIYGDLLPGRNRQPATAIRALQECDRIILLQPLMAKRLKASWKAKSSSVVMDVAKRIAPVRKNIGSVLRACVVGHLRYEKDPLRAAMAVRSIRMDQHVEVVHAGNALSDSWQLRAQRESDRNGNWKWLKGISHSEVQTLMRTSDLLINSSRAEGAPNVLFEAISWRLPIVASKIDGHVGVLGASYSGYFNVGDTKGLQKLILRCRSEIHFYRRLVESIDQIATRYCPGQERKSLVSALKLAKRSTQT